MTAVGALTRATPVPTAPTEVFAAARWHLQQAQSVGKPLGYGWLASALPRDLPNPSCLLDSARSVVFSFRNPTRTQQCASLPEA
jgi:hypothetical protein